MDEGPGEKETKIPAMRVLTLRGYFCLPLEGGRGPAGGVTCGMD